MFSRYIYLLLLLIAPLSGFGQGSTDSISLAAFMRNVYKWHNKQITEDKGFDPVKNHPSDTMYRGIDFDAINFMIKKLRMSGFFDEAFLANYRRIAVQMDKELRSGAATWREGDLPPFNHDADPWCNCPDNPGNYWYKIKLIDIKPVKEGLSFKWTWGGHFYYLARVKKKLGKWKINYLEGFDFNHYQWAKP